MPAASVCVADTVIVPSPSVLRSSGSSTTATGVLSAPVTVLVTVPLPPVKLTAMLAPASPTTVTTPSAAVASAAVAPSATPVPSASVGATGGLVSTKIPIAAAVPGLPTRSVKVFANLTAIAASSVFTAGV